MKIKTYKAVPVFTEMICDCGEKMKLDSDGTCMFTTLFTNYKYKCHKCGKTFKSKSLYKLGVVQYISGELIEEKEIESD